MRQLTDINYLSAAAFLQQNLKFYLSYVKICAKWPY